MAIAGVILAGGQGLRLGGADKAGLMLAGRSLLNHVADRLLPQVTHLAINANTILETPGDLPVLADSVADFPGPLAGILAGMDWAAAQGIDRVISAAVDTPFFPDDLVSRLLGAAIQAAGGIALARTDDQLHPTFGLWPVDLRDQLRRDLGKGQRRVRSWAEARGCAYADFPSPGADDPFFNINTQADLDVANRRLAAG